jgi:3-O-methylgallate 3,4-dioxygenase
VPNESLAKNTAKSERVHKGFQTLRDKVQELKVDVLIVFSDDQLECFDFNNYPAFAVYVGEKFSKSQRIIRSPLIGRHAPPGYEFLGHPKLATELLLGVMSRGFDPAFSMNMPKPDKGLAGGIIRSAEELTNFTTPIVPVMMNLYFAPQVTGMRSYLFGKAVREVIDEFDQNIRIGVVASGGLWHTPGMPNAWLNTEFDHKTLDLLAKGDARGMAEHFDSYVIPEDDLSQDISTQIRVNTGMPSLGGPAFGTRETCAWIAVAAVSEGSAINIVDYIDVFASPVGNAFAYCESFI